MIDQVALAGTSIIVGKIWFQGTWWSIFKDGINLMACDYVTGNVMNLASMIPMPDMLRSYTTEMGTALAYSLSNKFLVETSPMGTNMVKNFIYAFGLNAISSGLVVPMVDRASGMVHMNGSNNDITSIY